MTALKGLTIVELCERVAGEYTGKLLADFGAEVIKVERPGGSPTRRYGPHMNGESTVFAYCNTNKKSVVLDLANARDRSALDRLLARADALLDDHTPDWCTAHNLAPAAVRQAFPRLVHCAITPFGQDAPPDRHVAHPINIANAGGWAWHSPSEAAPDDIPLAGAGRFMQAYESGIDAALATAASLYRQRRTGEGQFIDLAEVEVQLSRADVVLGRVLAGDDEPSQSRRRYDMGGPASSFACADGFVYLFMTTRVHWRALLALMDQPAWAAAFPEDWLEFHCTPDRVAELRERFRPWVASKYKSLISEQAQKLGLPLVPVGTPSDLLGNPQYRHRGFFQRLAGPALGAADYPTVGYRMSASPVRLEREAPGIGQDQTDVQP